jgi:hypothetical protein
VAAQPIGQFDLPGSWPYSVALLHWLERDEEGERNELAVDERDSAIGALLTLVTDRRCQVVPELLAQVEGSPQRIAIPIYGQIDPALGSPMPRWEALDQELRTTLAKIASLNEEDAWTISAAMHMHYCAALLAAGDLTGAYALVVGGLETLAQQYGSPPSDWAEWDQAAGWDSFIAEQQLTDKQSVALRNQVMRDLRMRLAETFATYISEQLPATFWEEPVSVYTWGVNGVTGQPLEGTWQAGPRRAPAFAGDRGKLKKALKRSYQARSRFIHAGERGVTFPSELMSRIPGRSGDQLSFASLRGALRRLILIELEARATSDRLPPIEYHLESSGDS